jgi:ABC-type transport system involved in multi-copper enzyme maturation permease subunit
MEYIFNLSDAALAVREITAGIWMVLSIFLTVLFGSYFVCYVRERPWDKCTYAALALCMLSLSASLRSSIIWLNWKYVQNSWTFVLFFDNSVVFAISSFLSIVSCVICIYVFSPEKYCRYLQVLMASTVIAIPILLYYLV